MTDNVVFVQSSEVFDLVICAVGYERRCRHFWETSRVEAEKKIAIRFGFHEELQFTSNLDFFKGAGFSVVTLQASSGAQALKNEIGAPEQMKTRPRVCLDVSSMSRRMMALVFEAVEEVCLFGASVTVVYAPSTYETTELEAPILVREPISKRFVGRSISPDRDLALVLGLGTSGLLTIGAIQFLEPKKSWAFAPRGVDPRFDADIDAGFNSVAGLFEVHRQDYFISDPLVLKGRIVQLLNTIEPYYRVAIVPQGPKLFAAIALAVLIEMGDKETSVWYFSSAVNGHPIDRLAEGPIFSFAFDIPPR